VMRNKRGQSTDSACPCAAEIAQVALELYPAQGRLSRSF
jgi:hypothetical protein